MTEDRAGWELPGGVVIERDPADIVPQVLHDPDLDFVIVLETMAGGGKGARRRTLDRFRSVCAVLARELGAKPDLQVSRTQGLAAPPRCISPRWRQAAVWRLPDREIVVSVDDRLGKSHEVSIFQSPRPVEAPQ